LKDNKEEIMFKGWKRLSLGIVLLPLLGACCVGCGEPAADKVTKKQAPPDVNPGKAAEIPKGMTGTPKDTFVK